MAIALRTVKEKKIVKTTPSQMTNTGNLVPDAATAPASAFTDGSVTLTYTSNITVQECAFTTTGSPLFVLWSVKIEPSDPPDNFYVRLYRDSTLIYESQLRAENHCIVSGSMTDEPSAGTYTYYLKLYASDHAGIGYQRSLMLLEVKR